MYAEILNTKDTHIGLRSEFPAQHLLCYGQESVEHRSCFPWQGTRLFLDLVENLQGKQENPL